MRNKILLYCFVFALLIGIFVYVNDKKILDAKQEHIENLEAETKSQKLQLDSLKEGEGDYFSLENNEEAITYFENRGLNATIIATKIKDALISRNKAENDNELVPFEGMEGPMRINKIKILNHKWIIADFTDGTYWGEIFLTYEIGENGEPSFSTIKSFLYPKSKLSGKN